MELINRTPFAPFVFESRDWDGDDHFVLVLRGTFRIEPGRRLIPEVEQDPVVVADEYYGEPVVSSLRRANDLAPVKPRGELFVTGTARPPGGQPAKRWPVRVQCGSIDKTLRVTGPREWRTSYLTGWRLTDPEPTDAVPLQYELAYGGSGEHKGEPVSCEANPVGRGFFPGRVPPSTDPIPAPQIEDPADPINDVLRKTYKPVGFGPLTPAWPQRLKHAGTYDDDWLENRWPNIPLDFDYQFHNAAPRDQQQEGGFRGDELITLTGCDPARRLETSLPGYSLAASFTDADDYSVAAELALDTVHLDAAARKAWLVWRASILKQASVRKVVTHMASPHGDVVYRTKERADA